MELPKICEQLYLPRQMDTYEQYLILMARQVFVWQMPGLETMLTVMQFAELNIYRVEKNSVAKQLH